MVRIDLEGNEESIYMELPLGVWRELQKDAVHQPY